MTKNGFTGTYNFDVWVPAEEPGTCQQYPAGPPAAGLPAGLTAWFKTDGITGVSDGQQLSLWSDASGRDGHATQLIADRQPVYAAEVLNGLPVVRFEGDNYLNTSVANDDSSITVFVVARSIAGSQHGYRLLGWDESSSLQSRSGAPEWYASSAINNIGDQVIGNWNVYTLRFRNTLALDTFLNGASMQAPLMTVDPSNGYQSGGKTLDLAAVGDGGAGMDSEIAEFLRFDSALSCSDIQDVVGYLGAKWGITTTASGGVDDAGPWSPGPIAWYKADQIDGVADGQALDRWPDESARGHDATQSVTTRRPVLAAGVLNGLPVVRFDGTDDFLNTPLSCNGTSLTIFVVARSTGGTQHGRRLLGWNSFASLQSRSGAAEWYSTTLDNNLGGSVTNWNAYALRFENPTTLDTFRNGAQILTVNPNDSYHCGSTLDLGADGSGTAGMKADIAEVLTFGSALSNDDVDQVFTYLASKWGITEP